MNLELPSIIPTEQSQRRPESSHSHSMIQNRSSSQRYFYRKRPRPQRSSTALLLAALTASSTVCGLPLSNSVTGGYLTDPPSRNYLAYANSAVLPSSSRPLSTLPESEPTPHNLMTHGSSDGGTCGAVDGAERNYDSPMSRAGTLLPLQIRATYEAGSDIRIKVSLSGIDAGGFFEFHVCPMNYPDKPTAECFQRYPLEFVEDEYYAAVKDDQYPERAYVPLLGAFEGTGRQVNVVVDKKANPIGESMMQFSYIFKLPDNSELWQSTVENSGVLGNGDIYQTFSPAELPDTQAVDFSQGGLNQIRPTFTGDKEMVQDTPILMVSAQEESNQAETFVDAEGARHSKGNNLRHRRLQFQTQQSQQYSMNIQAPQNQQVESMQDNATPSQQEDEKSQQSQQFSVNQSPQTQKVEDTQATASSNQPIGEKSQWYATLVDGKFTPSNVETIPISSVVTDGNGTTTITTLEGVTVLPGGPKIPASSTITWGDKAIYGSLMPFQSAAANSTVPPTSTANTTMTENSTDIAGSLSNTSEGNLSMIPISDIFPILPSNQSTLDNSTKYVLLRWHYQTARECYPVGFDNYSWPESWGTWNKPWSGECSGRQSQENYWNCAEIRIVERNIDPTTNSNSSGIPSNTTNVNDLMDTTGDNNTFVTNDESPEAIVNSSVIPNATNVDDIMDTMDDSDSSEANNESLVSISGTIIPSNATSADDVMDTAGDDVTPMTNNKSPVATSDVIMIGENELAYMHVLHNDVDPDGERLHIDSITKAKHGHASIMEGNEALIYAPDLNFTGLDAFRYTICDRLNRCDTAKVDVIVGRILDLIFSKNDRANTTGIEPVIVNVTENDSVRLDHPLTVVAAEGGRHGTCEVHNDDQVKYVANNRYLGLDRCKYTACLVGNTKVCDEGWLVVKVLSPDIDTNETEPEMEALSENVRPIANSDTVTIQEGEVAYIDALANDEDAGKHELIIKQVSKPSNGNVKIAPDRLSLEYTSIPGFTGTDIFSYNACDSNDRCAEAEINVKVRPVTSGILALEDVIVTDSRDPPVKVDVLANDEVTGTKNATVKEVSGPSSGECSVTDDNQVLYTPSSGYIGWEKCIYTACVEESICDEGLIKIQVMTLPQDTSLYSEIIAVTDKATTESEQPVIIDVIANDISPIDQPFKVIDASINALHGSCKVTNDNQVEYISEAGFTGWDRCQYTVCVMNACNVGQIGIKVTSSKQQFFTNHLNLDQKQPSSETGSPEVFANDDEASAIDSRPISIDVTSNDVSSEGKSLEVINVSNAMKGMCEVTPNNQVKYTAHEEYHGYDRCIYTVCADDVCDEGRIEITVLSSKPVADSTNDFTNNGDISPFLAPVSLDDDEKLVYAEDDVVVTLKNTPISIDVTRNDFLKGTNPLAITHTGGSRSGDCVIVGVQIEYTPHDNFLGQDRCGYVLCENGICDEGIVRIKVIEPLSESKPTEQSLPSTSKVRSSDGFKKSSSVFMCSQANREENVRDSNRKLARDNKEQSFVRIPQRVTAESHSSCIGSSLVTTVVTPTQTITYTSTYHEQTMESPQTRSIKPQSTWSSTNKNGSSFIETRISLQASADATIMPGFPDINFGSAPSMLVSSSSSKSGLRESILMFDTAAVDTSLCKDRVISAQVSIYSMLSSTEGGTFITSPGTAWSEMEVNWNNVPRYNGIVLSKLGPVQAKKFYDVDLSSALILGNSLSIRIVPNESTDSTAQYASKDHSDSSLHPMLHVTCFSSEDAEQSR